MRDIAAGTGRAGVRRKGVAEIAVDVLSVKEEAAVGAAVRVIKPLQSWCKQTLAMAGHEFFCREATHTHSEND